MCRSLGSILDLSIYLPGLRRFVLSMLWKHLALWSRTLMLRHYLRHSRILNRHWLTLKLMWIPLRRLPLQLFRILRWYRGRLRDLSLRHGLSHVTLGYLNLLALELTG
jgi:hypothetical protein